MTSSADTVFLAGAVYHGPGSRPRSGAVAVTAGRVSALDQDAIASIGESTCVIESPDGLLLPGFVDAHIHPVEGGLERMRCDLSAHRTAADYLEAITAYATSHPDLPWIVGGGWQQSAFPGGTPLAADLDRIVPDRPVFLQNRDHHGAWVNTAALQLAGIDRSTPDPTDGRIERDEDGAPSGTLHEGARGLVSHLVPEDTADDTIEALVAAQAYLHSVGVTGWQDAIVGDADNHSDTSGAYLAAAASGALTGHVIGALWWDRGRGLEQIPDLIARRDAIAAAGEASQGEAARGEATRRPAGDPGDSTRRSNQTGQRATAETAAPEAAAPSGARSASPWPGRFTAGTIKIMQDGIPENRTAAMIEPYLGGSDEDERGNANGNANDSAPGPSPHGHGHSHHHHASDSGISFVEPELLAEAVTQLDAAGFQVHFHAIGDRAVRECLDAVEAAIARNGPSLCRHHIAHVQIVHPDDVPRFAELDVTMNIQSLWATWEPQMVELNLPVLGDERAGWQYPFADAVRSGARLCAGSDWPVTTPDPWAALHVAVNRTLPEGDPDYNPLPLNQNQALTLDDAIAGYTAGSNRVNHRDDAGTIQVGAVADLVLTDRDPFRGDPQDIHRTRTVGTWVAGRRVFTAQPEQPERAEPSTKATASGAPATQTSSTGRITPATLSARDRDRARDPTSVRPSH